MDNPFTGRYVSNVGNRSFKLNEKAFDQPTKALNKLL